MIIIFIPGFAGHLKGTPRQKTEQPATPPPPQVKPEAGAVGEGDLPLEQVVFPHGLVVTTKDGCVYLNTGEGRSPYEIELSRIPTAEALLGWIQHLREKTWVTGEHVVQFIHEVASRQKGWRFSTTGKA